MRMMENIGQGIIGWSNNKFSKLTSQELTVWQTVITNEILVFKGLRGEIRING